MAGRMGCQGVGHAGILGKCDKYQKKKIKNLPGGWRT